VFLGLNEVAGCLSNLQQGLREIGVRADLFDLGANPFGYGGSSSRRSRLVRLAGSDPRSWRRRLWRALLATGRARKTLVSALLLPWALVRYDAFILEGRDLFFDGRGLWLLRRFGKRIVILFLGSDHRPPYLNGVWLNDAKSTGYGGLARRTKVTAARVQRAERYAHAIVALPTSAQFHSLPFVHLLAIGLPTPVVEIQSSRPGAPSIRILHCPTKIEAKGSRKIQAAVGALQARGFAIELELQHGVPHHVVLDAIQRSDFVVDELYSDSPMAVFAAEAASFSRPAVVGGYAHDQFEELSADRLPPTQFCHPDQIESAIEELVANSERRSELGAKANHFVNRNWSPGAVAERLLRILQDDVDPDWTVDPRQISYVGGWGMSEATLTTGLAEFVAEHGLAALQLPHRPDLREALLRVAGQIRS
jgi:hypothetical protein